ncbi:hypothetical protein F5883DRAFT_707300 [Diaporthe sp. PMI_573]|nr:hypothetical protein F5883DRAFT_707300 [Diaporthaceae sp. PMI_573]
MLISGLLFTLSGSCLLGLTVAQVPPECGTICLAQASQLPAFANKTQTELCVDKAYGQLVASCVMQDCTVIESLSFLNFTRTECGLPSEDNRHQVRVVTLAMFALATVFFIIRMVVKYMKFTKWGPDDTWLAIAFILMIPFIVLIQLMIPQGLGSEIWVLHDYQITEFCKLLLAVQEHYILIISIVKASILAFFLRIFPDEKFRKVVWCTLALDLLVAVVAFIISLVQRQPTWLIWEGWKDKKPRGVVVDLNNLGLGHGGLHIVLDVWMIILPFTQLYKLNHPLHKKLGIFAMFSVGIFLTIVGAIRVHNMSTFATSENITNDVLETVIWSCIEVCVGVSVACMPHARQLFREVMRRLKRRARPNASMERPARLYWRPPRAFGDESLESGTAVGTPVPGPGDKSWYGSTMQSAYTTTTCTSDRQPSSFASDATTRVGSVGQLLGESAASDQKGWGRK